MVYDDCLEGKLVNLRSVEERDAEFTYQIRQNKEKTKFLHAVTGTIEDQRQWIHSQRERKGDYFFIAEDKNGNPIGTDGVLNIENNTGEVGRLLSLGTPLQSSETALLTFGFAFDICMLEYVRIYMTQENIPSLGFNLRMGAKEVNRVYDSELGHTIINLTVQKEDFYKSREKINKLIDRFGAR